MGNEDKSKEHSLGNDIVSKKERSNLVIGKWILIALAFFLVAFYFYNFFNTHLTQESAAQFGDYLGGVLNPILGFATIALLVWSIQIQLRELKLTREELINNTKANEEQAKELKTQNQMIRSQQLKENSIARLANRDKRHEDALNNQMLLINGAEKSIEDLFDKTICIKPLPQSNEERKTTFGELVFSPNSNDATLFIKVVLEEFKDNKGLDLIVHLLNIRLKGLVLCLCKGIRNDILPYDTAHWKLGWLVTMTTAFMLLRIFKYDYIEGLVKTVINSIELSQYGDDQKKELSAAIAVVKQINEKQAPK